MSNSFNYQDASYKVGDMIDIDYQIKEGDKERLQTFKGILLKIKGDSLENRMITVRKISNSGIGVERIIPLKSPYIARISLVKKSRYQKAKLYFLRNLSDQELRTKLYQIKTTHKVLKRKKTA
ncbi:50S ribosomal protein L19 [Candidatus Roizmanbacteria bacterium]|nr:50S ribosomal protein L19 [Candidatus Roizmanbacteria bacterium]